MLSENRSRGLEAAITALSLSHGDLPMHRALPYAEAWERWPVVSVRSVTFSRRILSALVLLGLTALTIPLILTRSASAESSTSSVPETVPAETVPAETVPAETVPPAGLPVGGDGGLGHSIQLPNSGRPPVDAGDRGGALQLTLVSLIGIGLTVVAGLAWRDIARSRDRSRKVPPRLRNDQGN